MLKKTLQLTIGLFIIGSSSFAQWGGSNTTSGDTYRDGNVGIGIQSPSALFHVYNANVPVNTVGSQVEFGRFSGTTATNASQFRFLLKRHTLSNGGWLNFSGRLQFTTDLTDQGYIEFNPKDGFSGVAIGSESGEIMRMTTNGNVGIGTQSPSTLLHVYNANVPANSVGSEVEYARFSGSTATNASQFRFLLKRHTVSNGGWLNMSGRLQFTTDVTDQGYIEFNPKDGFSGVAIGSENGEVMRVCTNGTVGIGTTTPGSFKLAVEGKIAARGVKVTNSAFADYVFDSTYNLRSLANLHQYINQNKHLPGIPSAKEVEKEGGFEVGEMNVKLLEKVEELTLYILELNKKLEQQQKEIDRLKK